MRCLAMRAIKSDSWSDKADSISSKKSERKSKQENRLLLLKENQVEIEYIRRAIGVAKCDCQDFPLPISCNLIFLIQ